MFFTVVVYKLLARAYGLDKGVVMFKTFVKLVLWGACAVVPVSCMAMSLPKPVVPSQTVNVAESIEDKTVALVSFEKDNDSERGVKKGEATPYCTGVWITNDLILTAEHCVDDIDKPKELMLIEQIMTPSDLASVGLPEWDPTGKPVTYGVKADVSQGNTLTNTYQATVSATDKEHDLALVKTEGLSPKHSCAALREGTIHDGEDVNIVGQTIGEWYTYMHGFVSSTRVDYNGAKGMKFTVLQVSAPAWFGNSGGGAWDSQGNLIGIMSYVSGKAPNMGFFSHRDNVRAFLAKNM